MSAPRQPCACCSTPLTVTWTDTHGVGVCTTCGLPYRVLHYEGEKRVEKPPEVILSELGLDAARRYWSERRSRVFPGMYDMGILPGRTATYSGATREQADKFNKWWERNCPPLRR